VADWLIEVMIEAGSAQLLTPPRLVTYPTALSSTTIDLAFATETMVNRLLECKIVSELNYSSNH
jgi:hypothetical protein